MVGDSEIAHLKKTIINLRGVQKDPIWVDAFDQYNQENDKKLHMNCRRCYYTVLMYFFNKK